MGSEESSGAGEARCHGRSYRERRRKKRHQRKSSDVIRGSLKDMRIEGSHRRSSVAPVFFWTSVFLLSLTCGIQCITEEQIRHERSPTDVQAYSPADLQALSIIRELFQRRQQQQQQQSSLSQMSNNGDGLSENSPDYEKLPLPLLLQALLTGYNDDSKEDVKRGSYMALCHFKICNMGRKRNGLKFVQRYRK
ncbi:UNVERIFIED_CONTAM: hypothetical protein PYX00_010523 [Menopon gallinae]